MSLPSQTASGLAVLRQVVVDVAQGDEVRRQVGDLDTDGLLARDRREDADLRRGQRVREVVLEGRDLRHLRPRGELELVARHAGADDLADHRGLDAEVGERLHERVCDLAARFRRRGAVRPRLAEQVPVGEVIVLDRWRGVEEALPVRRLLGVDLRERDQRRGLGRADHVRVVGGGVDERERSGVGGRDQLGRLVDDLARRAVEGAARGMRASADQRARGGAAEQQDPGDDAEDADDRHAGAAYGEPECVAESSPEISAFAPQGQEEPDPEHEEPRAERANVDEVAAADHEAADDDERDRQREGRPADERLEPVPDPAADVAAVPADPEHRGQEEAERDEDEPDKLGVVMPTGLGLLLRSLSLPHARGRARLQHTFSASPRHGRSVRRGPLNPFGGETRPVPTSHVWCQTPDMAGVPVAAWLSEATSRELWHGPRSRVRCLTPGMSRADG